MDHDDVDLQRAFQVLVESVLFCKEMQDFVPFPVSSRPEDGKTRDYGDNRVQEVQAGDSFEVKKWRDQFVYAINVARTVECRLW